MEPIRQALEEERDELEAEIQMLQSTMDVESNMLPRASQLQSRGSGPARSVDADRSASSVPCPRGNRCIKCGSRLDMLSGGVSVRSGDVYCGPGGVRRVNGGPSASSSASPRTEELWSGARSGLCTVCEMHNSAAFEVMQECGGGWSPSSQGERKVGVGSREIPQLDGGGRTPVEEDPKITRRPVTRGEGRSRVRRRIESARDERFFLDEDPFLN